MQCTTDVIIVKYGLPEYESKCIRSVLKHTNVPYHLTVYDNYPKDENLSAVWNKLIEKSDAEYICLLNNDTVVSEDWLEILLSVFESKDKVGAVGPISNRAGGHQGGHKKAIENTVVQSNMLSGFCVVFPKEVWEAVGGFDEEFHLYGEDSDFFRRVKDDAGYFLMTHYGVFIYHFKAQSCKVAEKRGKDIEQIRKQSALRYREKFK